MKHQPPPDSLEQWLRQAASDLPYPPTPDIAAALRAHRTSRPRRHLIQPRTLAALLAVALLIMVSALAVPRVRASIWAFLRLGSITFVAPDPMPNATPSDPTGTPATPRALLDLAGETTLADARDRVSFPIKLPTQPADLGLPDRVYVQNLNGSAVILIWLDPGQPDRVQHSLHQIGSEMFARKLIDPDQIERVQVNGQPAVWTSGRHLLEVIDPTGGTSIGERRLVDGNVLIWTQDGVTYRLETTVPLDQAIAIVESLK